MFQAILCQMGTQLPHGKGTVRLCGCRHISTSGLVVGASRASFVAIFAISCTTSRVCRPLGSQLTLNDARRCYFCFFPKPEAVFSDHAVKDRSIYCIKVGYCEFVYALSSIFLLPVAAYALVEILLSLYLQSLAPDIASLDRCGRICI